MEAATLIIGSGVAATALAHRLLGQDPTASILILEVGQRVKMKDFGLWEDYLLTGRLPYDPFQDLNYPARDTPGENASVGRTVMALAGGRVFAYGGSTLEWGGWAFRLKPEDFHLQSAGGQSIDWPYGYDELEAYYCEAEDYLAVSGDSADASVPRSRPYPFRAFSFSLQDKPLADAFAALGMPFGHVPIARRGTSEVPSRHAPCQTTGTCKYCPFGARFVASNYLDDLREWNDYPNLAVQTGALVLTIRTDGRRRVVGVDYADRETGERRSVEAERIVVAAGTIESAKLLLRSVSPEWPTGIGNAADMVGRHFIAHPFFIFTGTIPSNPLRLQPEMNFSTLVSRHFDSPAEQHAGKFILVNPANTVDFSLARKMQSGLRREEIDAALSGPNAIRLEGMVEAFGRFHNRIENMPQLNRLGMPETRVDFSADPGFDARIGEIHGHVETIYAAMGARLGGKPSISWRADHAAALCRMSRDEAQGVVDPDLRVHGMDNLYVCSNAVFPSLGAINPTVTLTALALKLGDHLGAQSKPGGFHGAAQRTGAAPLVAADRA